ncbi:thiamine phosphate synthase [Tunturiibacter gelidoferens]|uniref:Thiamine-phosphate pyrophosphorylase n=1 Tax=Tunturiibacter gelidiferens TaxID=3069689 RepID=A0ACC5P0S3_9BACT|nr:thiamine phosphate synthase [Edaphobacter lichenicola]MBB5340417.1 thiamine-phosphate pyrophosphorylase [Edaphobacter lichenicola]
MAPYTDFTMLRYAITSRALYPGDEQQKQAALLREAARWIADGIDLLQLREKDLPAATLAILTRNLLEKIALATSPTRLLINSRPDIAVATGAHGVHLSSSPDELSPTQIRNLFHSAHTPQPLITVSCHTLADIHRARREQVDAILYAPVFEKPLANGQKLPGQGLDELRAACTAAAPIPVYALGGVTLQNASSCLDAGAVGVAGIRLFHNP